MVELSIIPDTGPCQPFFCLPLPAVCPLSHLWLQLPIVLLQQCLSYLSPPESCDLQLKKWSMDISAKWYLFCCMLLWFHFAWLPNNCAHLSPTSKGAQWEAFRNPSLRGLRCFISCWLCDFGEPPPPVSVFPHVKSLQNWVHVKRGNIWNILSNSTSVLLRLSGIFTPSLSSLLIVDSRQYGQVQVTSKVVLKLGFESQRVPQQCLDAT